MCVYPPVSQTSFSCNFSLMSFLSCLHHLSLARAFKSDFSKDGLLFMIFALHFVDRSCVLIFSRHHCLFYFLPTSSFYRSSPHPSINPSHQLPEDRNASPARLSSTWWARWLHIWAVTPFLVMLFNWLSFALFISPSLSFCLKAGVSTLPNYKGFIWV